LNPENRSSEIAASFSSVEILNTTGKLAGKIKEALLATWKIVTSVDFYLVIISIVFVATLVGWMLYLRLPISSEEIELTSEETHLVEPNTYLFRFIEIIDKEGKVDTFYFENLPVPNKVVQFELNETVELEFLKYKYWSRYLNAGSTLFVSWSFNHPVSIYSIRGSNHIQNWSKGKEFVSANSISSNGILNREIEEPDDYYFIVENDKKEEELRGRIAFNIEAATYDTSKAIGYFEGSFRMDFTIGVPSYLVLSNPSLTDTQTVTIQYKRRSSLPFLLALFLQSGCCCMLAYAKSCGGYRRRRIQNQQPIEMERGTRAKLKT